MCGIAGIAGAVDPVQARAAIQGMLATMRRRGPDAEGVFSWDGAWLGHRRLAVLDLSDAGQQPMLSEDSSIGVVFNGAIYNFRELRGELQTRNYRFRSRTDTEVLIPGYREWGIEGLVRRLRGMFAFGLWDHDRKKLFLVRDRLGVKPLVYRVGNGVLTFASTVDALAVGGGRQTLNEEAVAEFIEYGFVTDARSIYRGFSKLPAAHMLEWSEGTLQLRRYWDPFGGSPQLSLGFEEAVEETERRLIRAVARRLEADVPVGVLLSGGVDSSLVCWGISQVGADITAYTVGIPGAPEDETEAARATAAKLGLRHVVVLVQAEFTEILDDLTAAYGEPFAPGSALGILQVSRAIRESATVVLTGDGGDDVFLGYPWHRLYLRTQQAAGWVPEWVARSWRTIRRWVPRVGPLRRGTNLLNYITGGIGAVAAAHEGLVAYPHLLGDRLRSVTLAERRIPETLESARNLLRDLLAFAQEHHFVSEFMTKLDGGMMFHGLEARSPFLDQELWELAASLAYTVRLHKGQTKAVLREIARRRVSNRVAAGRKRGFDIPVNRWLAGPWCPLALESFCDSLLGRYGYIREAELRRELHRARALGTAPLSFWYLFVLERWLRSRSSAGLVSLT